ncbi:MAG: hypothetical protein H0W70_00760 [Actinobacteria bacterium]|nr:hypothetical protein [Actinomycetota bacterium]
MPDESAPKQDRLGRDSEQGPNPAPGGQVEMDDAVVPPYEDRTGAGTSNEARRESVERQLEGSRPGQPGQTTSDATPSPVAADEVTSDTPESPHGVGESVGRRGEDMVERDGKEPGRADTGHKGADRPTGTSDERDDSGV